MHERVRESEVEPASGLIAQTCVYVIEKITPLVAEGMFREVYRQVQYLDSLVRLGVRIQEIEEREREFILYCDSHDIPPIPTPIHLSPL